MTDSTNELLEQGIQEVSRLSQRITRLSEQENSFKGATGALEPFLKRLKDLETQLGKLNCQRETMKWRIVWISLGVVGILQLATILIIIFKI